MSSYIIFKDGKWYKIKKYKPKWLFGILGGYWEVLGYEYYDCDIPICVPTKHKSDLVFKTEQEAKEYILNEYKDYIGQY